MQHPHHSKITAADIQLSEKNLLGTQIWMNSSFSRAPESEASLKMGPELAKRLTRSQAYDLMTPVELEGIESRLDTLHNCQESAFIHLGRGIFERVCTEEAMLYRTERAEDHAKEQSSVLAMDPSKVIDNCIILPGLSSLRLSKLASQHSGVSLGKVMVTDFANTETRVVLGESVRKKEVFILQTVEKPVNDHVMSSILMIEAAMRASAKEITVIVPYYPYARQDRKGEVRGPVSASQIANMLQKAGAHRVVTIDLHSQQVEGAFRIPMDNLLGLPLLTGKIADMYRDKKVVVVWPDDGMSHRANEDKLIEVMEPQFGYKPEVFHMRKVRKEVGEVDQIELEGDPKALEGAIVLMGDDMVDSGGTFRKAGEKLKKYGAEKVVACSSHGVFSGDAVEKFRNARVAVNGQMVRPIDKIFVTDALQLHRARGDLIEVVSSGPLIGETIKRIVTPGASLRDLRETFYHTAH